MRGGFTIFDGIAVSPAFSSSLTRGGNSKPTTLTFSKISRSNGGTLTTNSPVTRTLLQVSLVAPTVKAMNTGSWHTRTQVPKEAALILPSPSTVVIMTRQALGANSRSQCSLGTSIFFSVLDWLTLIAPFCLLHQSTNPSRYLTLRDDDTSFTSVQSTIFSIGTPVGTSAMLVTFFKP